MMTTAPTIEYATPPPAVKPHSRVGIVAFALGAFAAGAMLLCVLAVSFPVMNAPPWWETPAAIFGFTMLGCWVLSLVLALVVPFQRDTSRRYAIMALMLDLLAFVLTVLFISIA